MSTVIHAGIGLLLLLVSSCSASRPFVASTYEGWETLLPPPDTQLAYRVFLIGDAGSPAREGYKDPLPLLLSRMEAAGEHSAVVFLGDTIYCCGLPDSSDPGRATAEARLRRQLDAVRAHPGRVVFIPGNHDWNNSAPGGLATLRRQEAYVEAYLDRGNVFLPDDGFPGPAVVELTPEITLVALDTEWWLTEEGRPTGDAGDYDVEEEGDVLLQLSETVAEHNDRHVLVVGHHPLYSNGSHAGRFPLKTHLFPLTALWKNAYLPLPLVGSLYPLFIRVFGSRQDLAHPAYRALRTGLERSFGEHESVIYASGHEHSLQYFKGMLHDFIVSGGGARPEFVARGGQAGFAHSNTGFVTLHYYSDGSVWMEFLEPDAPDDSVVFRTEIQGPTREAVDPGVPSAEATSYPDYTDSTQTLAANPNYKKGPLHELLLGRHNRDVWALPVTVPYLDLGREAGGLTPMKRGGGMQTFSLRLLGADGREYSLRSIDKDPSVSLPPALRETVARDIVQDQIASIHPYGAFAIPPLARAAGVYHSEPRLVFVPDDPRLGVFRETFGNQLMMFELRPDEDMSDYPNVGSSEDVVSVEKMYEEIEEDNDNRIDVEAFVRARLFDMLLSDWDRHKNQWLWAEFDDSDGQGKLYRPVPKDRDWAFNRFDGVLPTLVRIGFDPKFQPFEDDFGNLKGLTLNGLPQDRRLAGPADRSVWIEQAAVIQTALTDAVIEAGIAALPQAVIDFHGPALVETLKKRRDRLPAAAEAFYRIASRRVDLFGSLKHEQFEVNRIDNETTEIVVYKITQEGEQRSEMYRRTFHRSETSEVVLYGLDGDDRFMFAGEVGTSIAIRVVGGEGDDTFVDRSLVHMGGDKAIFYDTRTNAPVATAGPSSRIVRSDDPAVNAYNPLGFQYNAKLPQVYFGYNDDDGLYVGGGMMLQLHGFRKTPYAANHRFVANAAARTGAYNVVYEGHFVDIINSVDIALEATVRSPRNIRNFFGLGNATPRIQPDDRFYQARFEQATLAPAFVFGNPGARVSVGGHLRYTEIEDSSGDFFTQFGLDSDENQDQVHVGVDAVLDIEQTDRAINPRQGLRWVTDARVSAGVLRDEKPFTRLSTALTIYYSPSLSPQVTLATRVGAAHTIGDFPFYEANTIGGSGTVRGWRSHRFAGRTSAYANTELRVKLLDFSTYVAMGSLGALGFFDVGRVWTEVDAHVGRLWHPGYGGGLWVDMFDAVVLSSTYGVSPEQGVFTLSFGFLY
ncbi:MAG: BamA/TamA family outer membrane protein [Rhodothermales bacterium]|nr:BamA/TamA family outer membrane protein [Rhodothermales bacterium]